MSVPKRHHYVPQMILNGFADADGWLYWCNHREKPSTVRRARPAELFLQNHLYSTRTQSGIKDPSMERALSVLENEAVGVIAALTGPARRGQIPVLSQEQMRLWRLFFLMQWRRTPENQRAYASDEEASRMIDELLDELRAALPHRLADMETYATREAKARTIRNVRVQSLLGFRANVMGALERRSIAVLRICQPCQLCPQHPFKAASTPWTGHRIPNASSGLARCWSPPRLSRSTLYRKVADGSFPRQVAISRRCVGWRASELEVWLHNPMFFHVDELPRR